MKVARFVLKLVALALAVGAAACCIIAWWDKIEALFWSVKEKLTAAKADCCCCETSDYADWDE